MQPVSEGKLSSGGAVAASEACSTAHHQYGEAGRQRDQRSARQLVQARCAQNVVLQGAAKRA